MTAPRPVYGYFVIRDLHTNEEVDRVAVHTERDSHITERVERGLAMKVDFDRFYFSWEDAGE